VPAGLLAGASVEMLLPSEKKPRPTKSIKGQREILFLLSGIR
jgi:hypothetical protein